MYGYYVKPTVWCETAWPPTKALWSQMLKTAKSQIIKYLPLFSAIMHSILSIKCIYADFSKPENIHANWVQITF